MPLRAAAGVEKVNPLLNRKRVGAGSHNPITRSDLKSFLNVFWTNPTVLGVISHDDPEPCCCFFNCFLHRFN